MSFTNSYQNYKLEVKATVPGTLSSFIWAYCKTVNAPEGQEKAFIRKSVSFAELSRYVRQNISNDFDSWYRINEAGQALNEVCATIINARDNRTTIYQPRVNHNPTKQPFYIKGFPLPVILVPVYTSAN